MKPEILKNKPIPPIVRKGGRPQSKHVASLARLQPGECFHVPDSVLRSARASLSIWAKANGVRITVRRADDGLVYCWRLPEPERETFATLYPSASPPADTPSAPELIGTPALPSCDGPDDTGEPFSPPEAPPPGPPLDLTMHASLPAPPPASEAELLPEAPPAPVNVAELFK